MRFAALLAILWVPTVADVSSAPDATTSIATLIVQLGLSGVFLWLYIGEKNQRMKRDDQLVDLATSTSAMVEKCTTVLQAVERGMAAQVERVSTGTSKTDWDIAQRSMQLVIEELRDELHHAQDDRREALRDKLRENPRQNPRRGS